MTVISRLLVDELDVVGTQKCFLHAVRTRGDGFCHVEAEVEWLRDHMATGGVSDTELRRCYLELVVRAWVRLDQGQMKPGNEASVRCAVVALLKWSGWYLEVEEVLVARDRHSGAVPEGPLRVLVGTTTT